MAFEKSKGRIKQSLEPDKGPSNDLLTPYSVRLPQDDINALQAHFRGKGLRLGQGLRMIIKEYMTREGI